MTVLRRTLRAHAWLALVAFLCGWMLPFFEAHPLGQDDAACVVIAGAAESSVQQIAAASDQEPPTHCVVCHLMRAMSGSVSADATTLAVPFVGVARLQLQDDSPLTVSFAPPSSRGPPATL